MIAHDKSASPFYRCNQTKWQLIGGAERRDGMGHQGWLAGCLQSLFARCDRASRILQRREDWNEETAAIKFNIANQRRRFLPSAGFVLLVFSHKNTSELMLILRGDAGWGYNLFTYSPMITIPELPVFLSNNSGVVFFEPSLQLAT